MKTILTALALLALAGCVTAAPSPAASLYAVKEHYRQVLVSATGYAALPDCDLAPAAPCSSDATIAALQAADTAAAAAVAAATADPTPMNLALAEARVDALSTALTGVVP